MINATIIKAIVIFSMTTTLCVSVYVKARSDGYSAAEKHYSTILADYNTKISEKILSLELTSITLADQHAKNTKKITEDVTDITKAMKGKTLTVIKAGECVPSKEFADSFILINKTVNQGLKK